MSASVKELLDGIYARMEGSDASIAYSERHGIESAAVLTVTDDETASLIALRLAPQIEGKTVIEIGGGIGLLACHLGHIAKHVYCIEANPMWAMAFAALFYEQKPKNVSYLFGAVEEFEGIFRGNVAVFCTHSGVKSMREAAYKFAPVVIDVYGEMIAEAPQSFDPLASQLRKFA